MNDQGDIEQATLPDLNAADDPARASPGSPALRLTLFGASKLSANGAETGLALRRGFALLAYLAHTRRPAPRGQLASMLWADVEEPRARARLRRLLYRLVPAVGPSLIVAAGDSLELRPGRLAVDCIEFARLAQDVLGSQGPAASAQIDTLDAWGELASQPLLQDVGSLSEAFESWRRGLLIDHENLLGRLLRHIAQQRGLAGDVAAALGTAEKLIRLDPFSELGYVLMMQLQAAQHSVSGVEAAYMRCADALRAEFGIRPGASTDLAYLAYLEQAKKALGSLPPGGVVPSIRFAASERATFSHAIVNHTGQALQTYEGELR